MILTNHPFRSSVIKQYKEVKKIKIVEKYRTQFKLCMILAVINFSTLYYKYNNPDFPNINTAIKILVFLQVLFFIITLNEMLYVERTVEDTEVE